MKIHQLYSGTIDADPGYHGWPTVVHIGGGRLLAVCSGNRKAHVCPFGRVLLYRSDDGGRSWKGPERLSQGPLDDRDAGIVRAADGTLLLNYFTNILAVCTNPQYSGQAEGISIGDLVREHGFWMRRSCDEGRSWSEKYSIPVNNPHGPTLCADGSLIFAGRELSHSCAYLQEGSRLGDTMGIFRSVDRGLSWERISQIPPPPGHDSRRCFELSGIETANGRLVVMIRDQNENVVKTFQTDSEDGGKSWSEPRFLTLGFPPHLLKLSDGRLLLSCGWRKAPYGVHVLISSDSALTWSEEIVLYDKGVCHDLGYPTTVELPDETLFTMWYENTGSRTVLKYSAWCLES